MKKDEKRREMIKINRDQTQYYDEYLKHKKYNVFMSLWVNVRKNMMDIRRIIGAEQYISDLHLKWMGDLSEKRVLDLGCYGGNVLSLTLARASLYYLGIDLSEPAIEILRKQLKENDIKGSEAKAIDFLSPEFKDSDFDVVYAHGVAHHFRHFDVFLNVLSNHLKPGGIVVTYDPLDTSLLSHAVRGVYRIFQHDKAWEWPFTKQTFRMIRKHFEIIKVRGIMGYAKWALPLSLISKRWAVKAAAQWHKKDVKNANRLGSDLWRCLHVTMSWRKPE